MYAVTHLTLCLLLFECSCGGRAACLRARQVKCTFQGAWRHGGFTGDSNHKHLTHFQHFHFALSIAVLDVVIAEKLRRTEIAFHLVSFHSVMVRDSHAYLEVL